jgi:nucleoside-diphosphate-sugar epimerase
LSRPVAALTGATGFLGMHLVRALDAAGYAVRVLARREPPEPGWGPVRPDVVHGELSNPQALSALVKDAAAVVHCAGLIKAADLDAFLAVNRDGTLRLAETARAEAPGAHFLLVSSLAARHPELSAYARSKRAGEAAAAQVFGDALTLVRPPAIYGPGDRATFAVFRAATLSPVLPVLAPEARVAVVHVEDAAADIAALAGGTRPGVWTLADARPDGYGWRELVQEAQRSVGRRPLTVSVPDQAVLAASRFGRAVGLLSGQKVGEILHKDWAVRPSELPPGRAPPRWSLAAGFASTAKWYKDTGWLR